jgi:hypothetical protein
VEGFGSAKQHLCAGTQKIPAEHNSTGIDSTERNTLLRLVHQQDADAPGDVSGNYAVYNCLIFFLYIL